MKKILLMTVFVLTTMVVGYDAVAQWSQAVACPGWNNPVNFTAQFENDTGGMTYCWSGQNGTANQSGGNTACNCSDGQPPNVMTAQTGIVLSNPIYTGGALANVTSGATYGGSATLPENTKQFAIMTPTSQAPGGQVNRDPNTNNQLKFVPDQFNTNDTTGQIINTGITRSIRIGDGLGDTKAAGLYYELVPTTENAIFIIYYAIVVEAPGHGVCADPAMIIRVMERNAANTGWVQKSDTLAYYITSTPTTTSCGEVTIGQNGWASTSTGMWGGGFYYKNWSKVVMNLSDCLYQRTRIEILVRDCTYTAHCAYAYVAGECRQMDIKQSGCPAGMSTYVTKLSAPRGMLNYEWSVSNFGVANPVTSLNPGAVNSYFSFRPLASGTEAQGHADYNVSADDFRVMRRPSATGDTVALIDSVGNLQTFRCLMTSAIDPSKPFKTPLYVNVQNTKPTMSVDTVVSCDGFISIKNTSYVPGDPTLVVDSTTTYSFYNNTIGDGEPYAVLTGDSVTHFFGTHTDVQSYIVRTNTQDPTCYSEALYLTTPLHNPRVGFTVSKHVLCDADETTITDTSTDGGERWWTFLKENTDFGPNAEYDTVYGSGAQNRQLTRGFSHGTEPIELIARNGMYYIDSLVEGDTVWCEGRAHDTVSVFLHPDLEVRGDTIVCEGSKTNAVVRTLGVDDCTYEWSRTYGSVTGGIPAGDTLRVVPYADTSVYFVRVTSPQGCVAWDSIHAYLVKPQLTMMPEDGRICPGQTATLQGHMADHYTWSASPADPTLAGQDSADVIIVAPTRNTVYTMIGHGSNDCDALPLTKTVTILPPPIPRVSVDPEFVDTDDPTVTLTDVSTYGVASEWLFENGEAVTGRSVMHTFEEALGRDTVYGDLTSYNSLGCPTQYRFGIPVKFFSAWLPNVFSPGSADANATFRLYSVNVYEYFHIYIYNRLGQLVFSSDDPAFEWDGTKDGEPCEQGAYVYMCNYKKPDSPKLDSRSGTVTLLR